jgi:uncharacterized lipoprotein YmbA
MSLVVLGAGGCLTLSPPPRTYLLSAIPPSAAPTAVGRAVIGVGPVTIPAYLDRAPIVVRTGDGEVKLSGEDRWVEPLRDGVTRTLAENLSAMVPTDAVVIFPWRTPRTVQFRVTVDFLRFDGELGGPTVLRAQWRLLDGAGKELVLGAAHVEETTGEPTYAALVAAQSRLLASLSRDIAAEIRTRLQQPSETPSS